MKTKENIQEDYCDVADEVVFDDDLNKMTKTNAIDIQVGGRHYKDFPIQPVEFISKNNLSFLAGCIIKRIVRYKRSSGKGLEDLQKIKHEVDLIIEIEGWEKK